MDDQSIDGSVDSSLGDEEDLDDIPLAMAPNSRYELDDGPPTSRGLPAGFARPGFGFSLNLQAARADPDETESPSPRGGNGLQVMRSEPVYLPETSRPRQPPGLSLAFGGQARNATSFTGGPDDPAAAAGLLTRRGPLKPPALSLVNPASASPVPSGAPTPAVHAAGETPPGLRLPAWGPPTITRPEATTTTTTAPAASSSIRVELISSAFVVDDTQEHRPSLSTFSSAAAATGAAGTPSGRIVERCCQQLGIQAHDLQLFELRPLEVDAIPEGCSHVGVMIRGSCFSLSAIEDMIARTKRDEQLSSLLEGALRDSSAHATEAKQQAERLAQQDVELAVLRERLRAAEAANQHLREQLQRSDDHRQQLGGTIRTMKKEFEDFKARVVVAEGAGVGSGSAAGAVGGPSGSGAAVSAPALPPPWDQLPLQRLSLGPYQQQGQGQQQGTPQQGMQGPAIQVPQLGLQQGLLPQQGQGQALQGGGGNGAAAGSGAGSRGSSVSGAASGTGAGVGTGLTGFGLPLAGLAALVGRQGPSEAPPLTRRGGEDDRGGMLSRR